MGISKEKIHKVRDILKKNNAKSGALFSACYFGNAFTNDKVFIGEGNGRKGKPVNCCMYWRWASMTKFLGLIALGAALEDGLLTLDDQVSKYIPEFKAINTYVSGSERQPGVDAYGTPNYKMIVTTEEGLGDKITIRNLIQSNSGFGYIFWGLGSTRDLLDAFAGTKNGQNYISFIQYMDREATSTTGFIDSITTAYNKYNATSTELILNRIKYPLVNKPGEDTIHGIDLLVLGAVIGRSLQMKGIKKTGSEYVKERIFDALEMKNSWIAGGDLQPPKDVKNRLVDAFFVRQNNIDGKQGPLVKLNTMYRCFDPEAVDDGFTTLTKKFFLKNKITNNNYLAGDLQANAAGTLGDFTKLMKLIIYKGKYKGKQILSPQTVEYLLTAKIAEDAGIWAFGRGTLNLLQPNDDWIGGLSKIKATASNVSFPVGESTLRWGGYYGTTYYFDISTGNYMVSGTQSPFASWYLPVLPDGKPPSAPYEPNALEIFSILST